MAARKEGFGGGGGEEEGVVDKATSAAVVGAAARAAAAENRNWRAHSAAVEAPPSLCASCWPRPAGLELAPVPTERATAAATARIIVFDFVANLAVGAVAAIVLFLDCPPLTERLFVVPRPLLLQQGGGPVEEAGAAPRICCLAEREKKGAMDEEMLLRREGGKSEELFLLSCSSLALALTLLSLC